METSRETILEVNEIQLLPQLLTKLDSPFVATSNYVQGTAFTHLNSWIIDFGANRHMTGSSKGLQSYSPSLKEYYVRITHDFLTHVSGICYVICTLNITLSFILHVLSFLLTYYLLALSPKNSVAISNVSLICVFKDFQTRKRISTGRLHDDLYIFDGTQDSSQEFF